MFLLPTNNNETSYEFTDTVIKSTIKKIITTKEKEVYISINRFTEEIIQKFSKDETIVRH